MNRLTAYSPCSFPVSSPPYNNPNESQCLSNFICWLLQPYLRVLRGQLMNKFFCFQYSRMRDTDSPRTETPSGKCPREKGHPARNPLLHCCQNRPAYLLWPVLSPSREHRMLHWRGRDEGRSFAWVSWILIGLCWFGLWRGLEWKCLWRRDDCYLKIFVYFWGSGRVHF